MTFVSSTVGSVPGQALPPIQPQAGFDLGNFLTNAVAALLWSIVAAMIFVLVVVVAMKIFNMLTPGMDEMEELKKGNMAVALVITGFLVAVSAVVVAVLLK
jgi:uncharacterized membrane protein YjfL (UPF0719 family)